MCILGVWIEVCEVAEDGRVETVLATVGQTGHECLSGDDDCSVKDILEFLVDGFLGLGCA